MASSTVLLERRAALSCRYVTYMCCGVESLESSRDLRIRLQYLGRTMQPYPSSFTGREVHCPLPLPVGAGWPGDGKIIVN